MNPLRTSLSAGCALLVMLAAVALVAPARAEEKVVMPFEQIMQGLKEKQNEELFQFMKMALGQLDKTNLDDTQIDAIIKRLREIRANDPYVIVIQSKSKSGQPRDVFMNRGMAKQWIVTFELARIDNRLRKLPMEQRVAIIVGYINDEPAIEGDLARGCFQGMLIGVGPEGVPFIVRQKPKDELAARQIINAVSVIGDPRGIDYLIDEMRNKENHWQHRTDAIEGLAQFKEDRVVVALIDALTDATAYVRDMHMTQAPRLNKEPVLPATLRAIQWAAGKALVEITGNDFGPLYNEDHATWQAWYNTKDKNAFRAGDVKRSDEQTALLIESLVDRFMTKRPSPYDARNALTKNYRPLSDPPPGTLKPYDIMIADLKALGPRVVPMLTHAVEARIKESSNWRPILNPWLHALLTDLDWPEAKDAAAKLDVSKPHVDSELWLFPRSRSGSMTGAQNPLISIGASTMHQTIESIYGNGVFARRSPYPGWPIVVMSY